MPSQTIRAFGRQSRASRALAALLTVACLLSLTDAAQAYAPPSQQKDRQDAARKAFDEGERLRASATPDSLREAVAKYEEAIKLWRESGDRASETVALASLGVTLQLLHRHEKAIEAYEQTLALLRASGERAEEGDILYNLGTAQLSLGRFDKALGNYERALAIQRKFGDRAGEGNTLAYLGAAYERTGRYAQAIENFERSLAIHRELRNRAQEGILLSNLGAAYNDLGRYDRALAGYQQALAIYREVRDRMNEGTTLANAGYAYYKLEQPAKAIEYYDRALVIERELGDKPQEANTLTKLALAQLAQGRATEAFVTAQRALAIQRELKDRYGEGRALDALGQISRALGKTDESLAHLGSALTLMRELGARAGEASTLNELMLTSKARDATRLAIFYGKQSINTYQELRQNISKLEKKSQESFVAAKQGPYRTLAGLLIAEGRLGEAQKVLDMLKQDEYFEFVRRDEGEGALASRAALSPEEAALGQRYKEISDRVASIGREWGELSGKEQLNVEEQKRLVALEKQLEIANAAFHNFLDRLEAEFAGAKVGGDKVYQLREAEALKEVLRELGGGAVALYTVVTEKKYYVVLYTPDAMISREQAIGSGELNAKIFAFREALQKPQSDPRPLAQELYRILVGPVEKDLEQAKAETLMWSLDGVLRYVPVSALYDGKSYLVERYRNVVFTPATQANLKDQPRAQSKGLGLGVSKAHGDFIALPSVPEELRSIFREESGAAPPAIDVKGILPGKVLMDEAFTDESLRGALRSRYPVVHIASHFAFKPGDETDSYLLLGDGSRLSLTKINSATKLFSGVELLTLSACDTASGGTGGDGKEVEGFGVLAQRQGAKAVVASLWPVSDTSTRLLMQQFYRLRGEGEGMSKAEALRRAQVALLRGDIVAASGERRGLAVGGSLSAKTFTHPYFWAPFILIGNWK